MRTALQTRYIPKGSEIETHRPGIVYTYQCGTRLAAIAYAGNANKSTFHNAFVGLDPEKLRQDAINSFFHGLEQSERIKIERRTAASKPHSITVGAIVYNSWGYDQTNVDFYEVVRVSTNYVWLQRLAGSAPETGFMCSHSTVPHKGTAHGAITKHKVTVWPLSQTIHFEFGSGCIWDGNPKYSSWYA